MAEGSCAQASEERRQTMIYRRGKKGLYWYRFRFGGRMIHESSKSKSKSLARDAERQRRRELEMKWNKVEKRELPPTFSEGAKAWLEKRKPKLAEGTVETYAAALKHLKDAFGGKLVCDIEAADVRAYQESRTKQEAAAATVNKEVICLGSILKDCGTWADIERDVSLMEEDDSPGRALEAEQETALLEAASNVGQKQGHWSPVYTVAVLGLNTGMRHSEIRRLKCKQIHAAGRVLTVGESKTEAGAGRAVPLNQRAWAAVEMWMARFPNRKPEDYVFPACENGHIDPSKPITNWRTAWHNACAEAELPGLRFHDLRHTAATKLLESGVPFAVVAELLGWSAATAVRMAKRYGHIRPEAKRKALEGIATSEIEVCVHQNVHQAGAC
jgi:integrase